MTTIIGAKFKNENEEFVVVGGDSQVSKGNQILPFPYNKIQIIDSNLVSGAGSVGYLQKMLMFAIRELNFQKISADDLDLKHSYSELVKTLSNLNFSLPLEHKHFNPYSFLVGGIKEGKTRICLVGSDGGVIDIPTYYSEGSGSDYALSILSSKYESNLSKTDAVELVYEALKSSSQLDVYTNNEPSVLVLTINKKAEWGISEFQEGALVKK